MVRPVGTFATFSDQLGEATVGEVTVSQKEIIREWNRWDRTEVDFAFTTNDDLVAAEAVMRRAVDVLNTRFENRMSMLSPATYPRGLKFFVSYCDELELFESALDELASAGRKAGLTGRLELVRNEITLLSANSTPGFHAGMSLSGTPLTHPEDGWAVNTWRTDPDALAAVVDHAMEWCQIEDGTFWVTSGVTSFEVKPKQRRRMLELAIGQSPYARLECGTGRRQTKAEFTRSTRYYEIDEVRVVSIDPNGHVLYAIGGDRPPAWEGAVANLTHVLRDLHGRIDYGFVTRDRVPNDWHELNHGLWNWPGFWNDGPPRIHRSLESQLVENVFGVQLLGPGHRPVRSLASEWQTEEIGDTHTLISDSNLGRWFPEDQSIQVALEARGAFAELLADQSWTFTPD